MIKLVTCDDNRVHSNYIAKLIREYLADIEYCFSEYSCADELLESCENTCSFPDIAILDIEMPGVDGLELAGRLNSLAPNCKIIFLSSYQNYMQSAYYTDHVWFVLKQDIQKHLKPALEKALALHSKQCAAQPSIFIGKRGAFANVPVNNIFYVERQRNKTIVATVNGKIFSTVHPEKLVAGCADCFIRCHQSYWINPEKVCSREANTFVLSDGALIPISRTYKSDALDKFFKHLHP